MGARYNGLADWYDARFVAGAPRHQPGLLELLGPGSGLCLDLGCGTGRNFDTIRDSGRTVVGVDRSSDQLRLARTRTNGPLIESDAARLPFADASFGTVIAMWITTDLDDFPGALDEAVRVLRPGGLLLCYGVHPAFNGPHPPGAPDVPHPRPARRLPVLGGRRHPSPRRHASPPPPRPTQRLPPPRANPRTSRRTRRHASPPRPSPQSPPNLSPPT
jgi:SAM-dependent methyltransferase